MPGGVSVLMIKKNQHFSKIIFFQEGTNRFKMCFNLTELKMLEGVIRCIFVNTSTKGRNTLVFSKKPKYKVYMCVRIFSSMFVDVNYKWCFSLTNKPIPKIFLFGQCGFRFLCFHQKFKTQITISPTWVSLVSQLWVDNDLHLWAEKLYPGVKFHFQDASQSRSRRIIFENVLFAFIAFF